MLTVPETTSYPKSAPLFSYNKLVIHYLVMFLR